VTQGAPSVAAPAHHTQESEQRKAEQKASKDDLVQYVEELAGPEDAWISLTDAAWITRTSEAMTRRWVTSGRLKVKKEPVGVPPRTRLVRMSDVAVIRPTVDPTAAITGEVRKLNLASIPRQQLQSMEDHRRLTKLMQAELTLAQQFWASRFAALSYLVATPILNFLLYRSQLVPRFISVWGFIALVMLATGLAIGVGDVTRGFQPGQLLVIPIILWELLFATWLIVRGFNASAIAKSRRKSHS